MLKRLEIQRQPGSRYWQMHQLSKPRFPSRSWLVEDSILEPPRFIPLKKSLSYRGSMEIKKSLEIDHITETRNSLEIDSSLKIDSSLQTSHNLEVNGSQEVTSSLISSA